MRSPRWRSSAIATASLCSFFALTGNGWCASPQESSAKAIRSSEPANSTSESSVSIPGPLRSFLRMAGVSQKVSLDEVLPKLARNVAVLGYRESKPNEFLVLLRRYIGQARELASLAGPAGVIRVSGCDDAKPLLQVIGYQVRDGCGPNGAVETSDPDRAFVTIDSGFPLANLEETLRGGKPFVYPFPITTVPALLTQNDWVPNQKRLKDNTNILDALLNDPDLARLYWAVSQMDAETRSALRQSPGLQKLVSFGSVLDFYGSQICIRDGRVVVPGGAPAEPAVMEERLWARIQITLENSSAG